MFVSCKSDHTILNSKSEVEAKPNILHGICDSGVIDFDLELLGGVRLTPKRRIEKVTHRGWEFAVEDFCFHLLDISSKYY